MKTRRESMRRGDPRESPSEPDGDLVHGEEGRTMFDCAPGCPSRCVALGPVLQVGMTANELQDYRYRGARALVFLHEKAMREFLGVWERAYRARVQLPHTENSNYASMQTVLRHCLRAARNYMTWLCEKLGLPDPAIDEVPDADGIEREAGRYLDHLLARWRTPLAGVEAGRFGETYRSRWNHDMTCESMLEHAVAHPLRHSFQLEELMKAQGGASRQA